MKLPILCVLIALSASFAVQAAKERAFVDEPEPPTSSRVEDPEMWSERSSSLPPWPKDSDLVEFRLDNDTSSFRYFMDANHLAIGEDKVVRYTLVAASPSGARNVSFEGLRCTPKGEYKIYAYGAGDRFQPIAGADWQPVPSRGDQLHQELHGHFLCVPLKFAPRPKKDMIRALQGPINPRQNTGFMPD